MSDTNNVARILDTILSIPGMNEEIKIDFKISRKNILLLSNIIERGLSAKTDDKSNLLDTVPKDSLQELNSFAAACLQKAGLTDFNEKLKSLSGK